MRTGSEGLEFGQFVWRHRRVIAIACASAFLLTAAISPFLPARYTAKATLLIEPPGGNDPRSTTAVSTVYLESLKTYELLVASDTLFSRAVDDLHLRQRYAGSSTESLKRRILAVSKPTNTTLLESSVTLNDAKDAQALAQHIAEQAVAFSATLDRQTDREIAREPKRIFDDAEERRQAAQKAADQFTATTPLAALEAEVKNTSDLTAEIGKDLARAQAELANYMGEQQAPFSPEVGERQSGWTELQIVATRAKIQDFERQERHLADLLKTKSSLLEDLKRRQDSLDAELKAARADGESAKAKLNDVQASAAARTVRLKVLDPGIVPQRPSFPNTPLNLAVAFTLSLFASVGFLAIRFAYERLAAERTDPVYSLGSDVLR
jgi:capsular polysaccharide biosynthesis protein